jgi:hypothetical protein
LVEWTFSFSGGDIVTVINQDPVDPLTNFVVDQNQETTVVKTTRVVTSVSAFAVVFILSMMALIPRVRRIKQLK